MESHLNSIAAKVGLTLSKLKPALPYLTDKSKREIIGAKGKPIAVYGAQLMTNQVDNF